MRKRKPTARRRARSADGRVIAWSISQPMPAAAGWSPTRTSPSAPRRAETGPRNLASNTVIENVPATIIVKDARTLRYVLINRAGEELFGIPARRDHRQDRRAGLPEGAANHHRARPAIAGERRISNSTTSIRYDARAAMSRHRDDDADADHGRRHGEPQYLLGRHQDVTEKERAEARIERLAHHDLLTDLPNRAAFKGLLRCRPRAGSGPTMENRSRSCASTSTASRRSTTSSATRPATRCCAGRSRA